MSRGCTTALAVVLFALPALAHAQPEQSFNPPLANWTAPPYWTPTAGLQVRPHPTVSGATGHGVGTESTGETTLTGSLPFYAVTPCRLVDTRSDGSGAYGNGETRV